MRLETVYTTLVTPNLSIYSIWVILHKKYCNICSLADNMCRKICRTGQHRKGDKINVLSQFIQQNAHTQVKCIIVYDGMSIFQPNTTQYPRLNHIQFHTTSHFAVYVIFSELIPSFNKIYLSNNFTLTLCCNQSLRLNISARFWKHFVAQLKLHNIFCSAFSQGLSTTHDSKYHLTLIISLISNLFASTKLSVKEKTWSEDKISWKIRNNLLRK